MKKTTPVNIGSIRRGLITTTTLKELNAMSIPIITTIPDKIKTKICSVCGKSFPLTEDYFCKKDRKHGSKDGFRSECKTCRSEKRRASVAKNKDHYTEYKKQWEKNNPDKVKRYSDKQKSKEKKEKIKRENTPDFKAKKLKAIKSKLTAKAKTIRPSIVDIFGLKKCSRCGEEHPNTKEFFRWRLDYASPDYSGVCINCDKVKSFKAGLAKIKYTNKSFKELSNYDETRKDPDNQKCGQVKCAYCGKWITPTYSEVKGRIQVFHNTGLGECRIYCPGDQCREACPTYKQQFYPKGFKVNTSRETVPLIRQMCMERDEYTCQICGATGEGVTLHAHHILSYARNKMLGNDIENVICLCKFCHNEIHHRKGCTYHDARCDAVV